MIRHFAELAAIALLVIALLGWAVALVPSPY